MIIDINNVKSGRNRRKEQMKRHRNYKNAEKTDLTDLKQKYVERRKNREQIQINKAYNLSDLTKGDDDEEDISDDIELNMMNITNNTIYSDRIDTDEREEEDEEYDDDDDDYRHKFDEYNISMIPTLPKAKSVLLDIEKFSVNLAAVIEEDSDEEDDDEKYFQTIEYQTDSDCDSNDSVVIKKEIPKLVTVNDLQKFDTV
eukprot:119513_1